MSEEYKTKARYIDEIKELIKINVKIAHGEFLFEDGEVIARIDKGKLQSPGGWTPAIELTTEYLREYYEQGLLHNIPGRAAVIADGGLTKEFWDHGVFQRMEYSEPD